MNVSDLTFAQAFGLVLGVYAGGFLVGIGVAWVKRIANVA